jgi:hypothetical protein
MAIFNSFLYVYQRVVEPIPKGLQSIPWTVQSSKSHRILQVHHSTFALCHKAASEDQHLMRISKSCGKVHRLEKPSNGLVERNIFTGKHLFFFYP